MDPIPEGEAVPATISRPATKIPSKQRDHRTAEQTDTSQQLSSASNYSGRNNSAPSSARNKAYKAIQERSRSHGVPFSKLIHPLDPHTLGREMMKKIMQNLDEQHLDTSRMKAMRLDWLFPRPNSTQHQLQVFQMLHAQPMTVTNADLNRILRLELSTSNSPPTSSEQDHFYVRSWTFRIDELEMLLQHMEEQDNTFEETDNWKSVVNIYNGKKSGLEYLTVRYVGTCAGPRRPFDRYQEDIISKSRGGILHEFSVAVEQLFPEVAEAVEIHLIRDASLPAIGKYGADDMERLLIEVFGHSTLLNRQRGGFYSEYIPSIKDYALFQRLKTNFYSRFLSECSPASPELRSKILAHFQDVQDYTTVNPEETGTSARPFTDGLRDVLAKQATPFQCNGYTVIVFFGKDITLEEYFAETSFISGKSRAGLLTRSFLRRLASAEVESHSKSLDDKAFDPAYFCFYDLWKWPKHKRSREVLQFSVTYMQTVRPLVVVTYSRPVTGIATANFLHEYGIPPTSFTENVGKLSIQYYSSIELVDGDREDDAFICIPHIHPGRDKYGAQDVVLRRVFDLTLQLTILVGNVALSVIDSTDSWQFESRKKICQEILRRVHFIMESTDYGREFTSEFEIAKKMLREVFRRASGRMISEDVRPILNRNGQLRMADMGEAEGLPDSKERHAQLDKLWDLNVADLHLSVPHDLARKEEWKTQFMSMQTGQYLYLQVLSRLEPDDYQQKLLDHFRPAWAKDSSWLRNSAEQKEAVLKCGMWIHKQLPESDTGRKVRPRRSFPDQWRPTEAMQGHNIGISDTKGKFILRWKKSENESISLRLNAPMNAVPKSGNETRAVSFTPFGLDIVDAAGNAFLPKSSAQASIPREHFLSTESGTDLVELWTAVLKHLKLDAKVTKPREDIVWDGRGVDRIARNSKTEKPLQNRPPGRLDALFLLNEFLKERLPNGGIFHTQTKDKVPGSSEDLQAFVAFLKQPEYIGHPYSETWRSDLDRPNPIIAVLQPNLSVLRSCEAKKTQTWNAVLKKPVWETVFHLGAPGSAGAFQSAKGSTSAQMQDSGATSSASGSRKRKADIAVEEGGEGSAGPRKGSRQRKAVHYNETSEDFDRDDDGEYHAPRKETGQIEDEDEDEFENSDAVDTRASRGKSAKSGKSKRRRG